MEKSVYTLLDDLEDMIEKAKQVPLSSNVRVSKEEIFSIIEEIRLSLPQEIKQAQRIVHNSESIIENAHASAQSLISTANETAEKMTQDHEITKRAQEEAEAIINDARNRAEDMRIGAIEYADKMLENTEGQIKAVLENFSKRTTNVVNFLNDEGDAIYSEREALRDLAAQAPVLPYEDNGNN